MIRFSKVPLSIWNDAKFSVLSHFGKLVFLFLYTNPHQTMLGAMRATVPGMAAELRMDLQIFAEAFQEILSSGLARHDEGSFFVWIPDTLKHNDPQSPNVIKAWPKALELLPECNLKLDLENQLALTSQRLPKSFRQAFAQVFPMASESLPKDLSKPVAVAVPVPVPVPDVEETEITTALTASQAPASIFITLPLKDKSDFSIDDQQIARWKFLYPDIGVEQEVRNYAAWAEANPKLRKTRGGILRSVNGWLAKEQNRFKLDHIPGAGGSTIGTSLQDEPRIENEADQRKRTIKHLEERSRELRSKGAVVSGLQLVSEELENLTEKLEKDESTFDKIQIEESITVLEGHLNSILNTAAGPEKVAVFGKEAQDELGNRRHQMKAQDVEKIVRQGINKRLLKAFQLSRLSLFYMDPM